jgi:hypothetical protein
VIRALLTAAGLAASAAGALAQQPDEKVPPPRPVTPKTDPAVPMPMAPSKGAPLTPPAPVPGSGSVLLPPAPAAPGAPARTFADYPPSNLPPPGPFGYGTLPPRIPYGPSVSPLEYPYPLYSTPPGAPWPQHTPTAGRGTYYGKHSRR